MTVSEKEGPVRTESFFAGFDARGSAAFVNEVMTEVALVHDSSAGGDGLKLQVYAHPALTLRDKPGADGLAFGAPQTQAGVYDHGAVTVLVQGPEGAKACTGGVVAVHASPGDEHLPAFYFHPLNRDPVIRRQGVDHVFSFRPVVMELLRPKVLDGLFGDGESLFIQVPACRHA